MWRRWWAAAAVLGGTALAQPVIDLHCPSGQGCARLDGTPKIGTSIRPAPPELTVRLPLNLAARSVDLQFIADRRGRLDFNHLEAVLVRSGKFGGSASRLNTLVNYRCVRLDLAKPTQAAYSCRKVR
ncbi:hypothetical protein DKM44_08600 [Deinococcus irradiatisoli]|uniref:Uncharacterized protein n=1 Tax=Deinococcus irradiatisoli TaxID=2202254 RepID=A0A2Z3JK48_9DEIO|nr:hypothetical protein DKM44_08600 [Deinococcus irradiatisoli]